MSDPHPDCPICRPTGPLAAPRHVAAWTANLAIVMVNADQDEHGFRDDF